MRMFYINQLLQRYDSLRTNYKEKLEEIEEFQIEVLAIINPDYAVEKVHSWLFYNYRL